MNLTNATVVFFDLGDTMVQLNPVLFENAARNIAYARGCRIIKSGNLIDSVDKLAREIRKEWALRINDNIQMVQTYEIETNYWMGFYAGVLARMGVPSPEDSLLEELTNLQMRPESFVCFPELAEALEALTILGVRLGIISNAFPSARKILNYHNLVNYFQYIFLSCEVPESYTGIYSKPALYIYRHAIQAAQALPCQAFFVDDRAAFVDAAKRVGMQAFLLCRGHSGSRWARGIITDLRQILYHLEPWAKSRWHAYACDHLDLSNAVSLKRLAGLGRTLFA